jgi:hypothetical protein
MKSCRNWDDSSAVWILALHPTAAQLEARSWLNGTGDVLGKERPLDRVVAEILDMRKVEEEKPPRTGR